MNTDELYHRWLARKRTMDIPDGWGASVMQRIEAYETSRHRSPSLGQACLGWLGGSLPARLTVVLAGSVICVTRFVVLFLATLG